MENINKLKKTYFITKILIFTKLSNPIRETRVLKLVFITIPCLKFWALSPKFKTGYRHEISGFVNGLRTFFM